MAGEFKIRRAMLSDSEGIFALVHLNRDQLVPRSMGNIVENIDRFVVATSGRDIVGCAAYQVHPEIGQPEAATVEIVSKSATTESSAFIVPATALIHESKSNGKGANFVWLYKAAFGEETGEVRRVAVTTGLPRNDGSVEITGAALTNGDRIVTAGAHLLREGQKVRLMDAQQ